MFSYRLILLLMLTLFCVHVFAGVQSVSVDVSKEAVLVESALTSAEVQALIESTGRRAVLKGIGGSEQGEKSIRLELLQYQRQYIHSTEYQKGF